MRIIWLPPESLKAAEFLRSCQAIVVLSKHHETAVRHAACDILEDARIRLVREQDVQDAEYCPMSAARQKFAENNNAGVEAEWLDLKEYERARGVGGIGDEGI